jgi:hypothetical protein
MEYQEEYYEDPGYDDGPPESIIDTVVNWIKSPVGIGAISFLVGLFFGLVVLGWNLWPVKFREAAAEHLRPDLQEEWARMVVDSYTKTKDEATAIKRLNELGDKAPDVMARVFSNPADQNLEDIVHLQALVNTGVAAPVEGTPAADATPMATETAGEEEGGGGLLKGWGTALILACAVTLILAVAIVAFLFLRNRSGEREPSAAMVAQEYSRQAEHTDYEALGESPPVAQWMTTYLVGDDLFDDSFSIDSPTGEFMGECGVGIAETIGVGDPKRVSAFEVWLFDKNDIQTVTKVLMSNHAFNDGTIRDRLSAKGEPIVALPGKEIILETATLNMVARVVDMAYGEGALPDQSFFDRITIELAVWPKA